MSTVMGNFLIKNKYFLKQNGISFHTHKAEEENGAAVPHGARLTRSRWDIMQDAC